MRCGIGIAFERLPESIRARAGDGGEANGGTADLWSARGTYQATALPAEGGYIETGMACRQDVPSVDARLGH